MRWKKIQMKKSILIDIIEYMNDYSGKNMNKNNNKIMSTLEDIYINNKTHIKKVENNYFLINKDNSIMNNNFP